MKRPRILLIYTGGTIGMAQHPVSHTLVPFDFDHLIDNVPRVKKLDYDIINHSLPHPVDSSNMNPAIWAEVAHIIEQNYDDVDGFVVLHGTDTMAYTASALSFMLENLRKPVIITGSQLPIGEVRTDGEENLITALQIAAARDEKGVPMVQEVAIFFECNLWRGNRSTKMSASNFDAFRSNNYPALAHCGLNIEFARQALYRPSSTHPLHVNYDMDTAVMFLDIFPGISEQTMRYLLNAPDIKGIVLRTYGSGNSPSLPWFTSLIREAVKRGIVIVNVTQCAGGSVHDTLYETGKALTVAGVISGRDITGEAAITKLMYLFGKGLDAATVKKQMQRSLCGELTPPA